MIVRSAISSPPESNGFNPLSHLVCRSEREQTMNLHHGHRVIVRDEMTAHADRSVR